MVSKGSEPEDFNFDFNDANSLNIYIHGVDNFNPITTIKKYIPESEIQLITINNCFGFFRIETLHWYKWSGNINPHHRAIASQDFYRKLNDMINDNTYTKVNIIAHSHGGNLSFANGNSKYTIEAENCFKKCKEQDIKLNYILIETPVISSTEAYIKKTLEQYNNISVTTLVAGNDLNQVIDVFSNFPFCDRWFDIKNNKMKQFQVRTKQGNKMRHNDLEHFINILCKKYYDYKKTLINNTKRSFLHKLFFLHGGKITTILVLLSVVLVIIKMKLELIKKKLKEFSQHFKK